MKRLFLVLFAAAILPALGQGIPAPYQIAQNNATPPPGVPPPAETNSAPAAPEFTAAKSSHAKDSDRQATIDQLRHSNQELMDLLDKQQKVLEDIVYDRRLQARQVTLLEGRLEDALQENAGLRNQITKLQTEAEESKTAPAAAASVASSTTAKGATPPPAAVITPAPPPAPASYLPAIEPEGPPGTMWWHRVLTISGDDSKNSDVFHIAGQKWRVVWHNEDRPGKVYKNTSLLFINAFPKSDTIPKKVCSQLGSGGDTKELTGTGDYYLKVEASGGHWEAAVEDFR